jgi:hypothetical protein
LPLERQEVERESARDQQHVSQRRSASDVLKQFVLLALPSERGRCHERIVNALREYL